MLADDTVAPPSYGYTYTAVDEPEDNALLVRIVVPMPQAIFRDIIGF